MFVLPCMNISVADWEYRKGQASRIWKLNGGSRMERMRIVRKRVVGQRTRDGAGVRLTRVLSWRDTELFDPFLMLDFFDSTDPRDYQAGFPWHPHRGIETVTFLAEGRIEHGDSLGNAGVIGSGDCQWMTAGGGIIHQEMPKPAERMFGVQLWVNLPASRKMMIPQYRDLRKGDIPVTHNRSGGGTVRIVAGSYSGVEGPARHVGVHTRMLELQLPGNAPFELETPERTTVFAFLQEGKALFSGDDGPVDVPPVAVLFGEGGGIRCKAGPEGARMLILTGDPLHEPIAWRGPIVMNTEAELDEAFSELDKGTFIRSGTRERELNP
jgi:quercetin 2,3-dioxygenase